MIELLKKDDQGVIEGVEKKGKTLLSALKKIQEAYPDIIKDVRGRGLLIGVDFSELPGNSSFLLSLMADIDKLGILISSYLLNRHKIRTAPTLNTFNVVRFEPSLNVPQSILDKVTDALGDICDAMTKCDCSYILGHLVNKIKEKPKNYALNISSGSGISDRSDINQFCFLVHFIDENNFLNVDDSLKSFSIEDASDFIKISRNVIRSWESRERPVITSKTGQKIAGRFPVLNYLPMEMVKLLKDWEREFLDRCGEDQKKLEADRSARQYSYERFSEIAYDAIKRGISEGDIVIGLGGLTSSFTNGGLALLDRVKDMDIAVTTGNRYTIVMAMEGIEYAVKMLDVDINDCTVAVIGATGSIGNICARMIARQAKKLILVGNPNRLDSLDRLRELGKQLYPFNKCVDLTTDTSTAVKNANIIISASSSSAPLIQVEDIRNGAIICDIALPHDVSMRAMERNDILIFDGGMVELPDKECSLGMTSGCPKGLTLACQAETMIMAFEGIKEHSCGRDMTLEEVERMRMLGEKHGFKLAGLRKLGQICIEEEIESIKSNIKGRS